MSVAKQKGTTFETAVVTYLNENGIACERRTLSGSNDKGDITVYSDPTVVLECKATKNFDLAGHCAELETEMLNAKSSFGAVILKAPRKPIAKSYVILPLSDYVNILKGYLNAN
jgi:Holliday junction resolvase